jgi:beta-barrel assembly-enhancing protease
MKFRRIVALLLIVLFPLNVFALTIAEESKYGREVFISIAKAARLSSDPFISIYMGLITKRLEGATELPFPIKLSIIQSETLDAFATVGGYVFLTEGMIEQCDKEEEIAGVLAHEFGHVGKRHVAKNMEKEKYINWGMMAAMLLALLVPSDEGKAAVMSTSMGASQAMALKYSREAEEEADRVGIATAEKAGYSGLGTAEFLKKLRVTWTDKTLPQYLLTHPYSDDRIAKADVSAKLKYTIIDDSLFPFVAARANILTKPLGVQNEEIWIKRYRKDPLKPINEYGAAIIYSMKGDAAKAEKILMQLESPHKPLFLGEFLIGHSRFSEAVDKLKAIDNPLAFFYLGKAYEGLGNMNSAEAAYSKILPYSGSYPEIYQRLAMVYGKMGNEAKGYEYLGRYNLEAGRDQQAKMYFEKAITKYGINSREAADILPLLDAVNPKK